MKTKLILPWQVKPGMKHEVIDIDGKRRVLTVARVEKNRPARFAGGLCTVIHFESDSIPLTLHHRKPTRIFTQVLP